MAKTKPTAKAKTSAKAKPRKCRGRGCKRQPRSARSWYCEQCAEERAGGTATVAPAEPPKPPARIGVVAAVEQKLGELEERVQGVSAWPLSALALSIAAMVADKLAPVSARASASRELRATLADLEAMLPKDSAGDGLDKLADGVRAKLELVS